MFFIKGHLHTIETRIIYLVNHNISLLLFNFDELIKISLQKVPHIFSDKILLV